MKSHTTPAIASGDRKLKWEIPDDWQVKFDHELAAWVSAIPCVLIWMPAALAVLYLKFATINKAIVALAPLPLGMLNDPGLSLWDKVSFFRGDILACVFVVPLALLALARFLPRGWASAVIALLCAACILLAYFNTIAIYSVGRLLSSNLILAGFHWGLADPQSIKEYLHPGGLARAGLLVAFVILISWWSSRREKKIDANISSERRWGRILAVILAGSIVITVVQRISSAPSVSYHKSILAEMFETFMGIGAEAAGSEEFSNLDANQLVVQYRELANAPAPEKDPRYWGKAAGADVILFVLETGPAASLAIAGNLDDMPVLQRLREKSFVGSRHYSTYPYTSRAHFSIFSSWYPSNRTVDFTERYSDLAVPGIMRILPASAYETVIYRPFPDTGEPDRKMYQDLGFQRQGIGEPSPSFSVRAESRLATWNRSRSADTSALSLLKKDMEDWLTRDRRFAVAFVPQEGHGPWPDVTPDQHLTSVVARGRAIMAMQDSYLGELVDLLEKHHRLERTIIVVTADHGIRTRVEDSSLQAGMVDDYSFHVPLLIYAPQVLKTSQTVPWMTSHIDIQPTLLDLLGVEQGRNYEQGSPIWDSRLADRTNFFFANHYLGADGYNSNGRFFMQNQLSDAVYQSDHFHFTFGDTVPATSSTHQQVTETIRRITALQQQWVSVLGRPHS
jgi:phosphoglycerol transferase MdoB-like AlkP superfamily enzyme